MTIKTFLNTYSPVILALAIGFPVTVYAEAENMGAAVEKAAAATPDATSLTQTLVQQLGITEQQAQGGAGAIFNGAKDNLNSEQFAELSKSIPEMDTLLGAVPEQSESAGKLSSGIASVLGDEGKSYGNLAGLASSFEQLKLSPDMVDQFVPVVVDYVRSNGGAGMADMLQSALYGM